MASESLVQKLTRQVKPSCRPTRNWYRSVITNSYRCLRCGLVAVAVRLSVSVLGAGGRWDLASRSPAYRYQCLAASVR